MLSIRKAELADLASVDVRCIACDYNLRGLSPSGSCPECGTPISDSHAVLRCRLAGCDPRVVRGVARIALAWCALVVLAIAPSFIPGWSEDAPAAKVIALALQFFLCFLVALLHWGAIGATSPPVGCVEPRLDRWRRRGARVLLPAWIPMVLLHAPFLIQAVSELVAPDWSQRNLGVADLVYRSAVAQFILNRVGGEFLPAMFLAGIALLLWTMTSLPDVGPACVGLGNLLAFGHALLSAAFLYGLAGSPAWVIYFALFLFALGLGGVVFWILLARDRRKMARRMGESLSRHAAS